MVAVRTDLFCDFMVELRLLQQRNFFDAGVLSLPQNPVVGAMFYLLFTVLPALFARPGDFRNLTLGGLTFDWTFAMAFAALFIFPCTHTNLKVPRWLFYAFYPIHLLIIGLVRLVLKV